MVWSSQDEAFRELRIRQEHETYVYPDASNKVCTLTAGGTDNTWGTWAELDIDGDGETLSSKVTSDTHITAIQIENLTEDLVYILELAYGDDKTNILRHRFLKGGVLKLTTLVQFIRIRSVVVPVGETIYYRMMCATGGSTCEVSFRYHYHT